MLSIFSCVCWPCVCFIWRNICLGLPPIFDWVTCCCCCLFFFFFFWYEAAWGCCIFWRLILCQLLHLQILLPFWGLSFHLLCGFLCCTMLLSLIRSYLFIFSFLWEMGQKGSCCDLCQRIFCLFSCKNFIVVVSHLDL